MKIEDHVDEAVDLGSIVEETKGSVLGFADSIEGQRIQAGLTED